MTEGCGNFWSGTITWVLVFAGWVFVHQATLSRERRREKRESALSICACIRELEAAAIDFHTADHFDGRKATDLRQQIARIILQLQSRPLSELRIPLHRMTNLRQRLTRHNADPSDFVSQAADSEIVYEIRNAVTDLIASIDDERERQWV